MKSFLLLATIALAALAVGLGVRSARLAGEVEELAAVQQKTAAKEQRRQAHRANLTAIRARVEQAAGEGAGFHARVRAVLEFVHRNSTHQIDEEHRRYSGSVPKVVDRLLQAADGAGAKPHLSCGPRSYAMEAILREMGIHSRLVQIYSDEYANVRGHRLVEVFNPGNSRWELWDPDFGVWYLDQETGQAAAAARLVFGPADGVVPSDGSQIGWQETGTDHLLEDYFEAILYESYEAGMTDAVIAVNVDRFDTGKVFADGRTFEQWAVGYYKHPSIVKVRGR